MSDFTVDISQNEYLPEGGDDVDAIITGDGPRYRSRGARRKRRQRGNHHH